MLRLDRPTRAWRYPAALSVLTLILALPGNVAGSSLPFSARVSAPPAAPGAAGEAYSLFAYLDPSVGGGRAVCWHQTSYVYPVVSGPSESIYTGWGVVAVPGSTKHGTAQGEVWLEPETGPLGQLSYTPESKGHETLVLQAIGYDRDKHKHVLLYSLDFDVIQCEYVFIMAGGKTSLMEAGIEFKTGVAGMGDAVDDGSGKLTGDGWWFVIEEMSAFPGGACTRPRTYAKGKFHIEAVLNPGTPQSLNIALRFDPLVVPGVAPTCAGINLLGLPGGEPYVGGYTMKPGKVVLLSVPLDRDREVPNWVDWGRPQAAIPGPQPPIMWFKIWARRPR